MKIIDKKPTLFEKTECSIWTDSYIQQQMLKAHLDPLSDGASRKEESILKITDFICQHTTPEGRLLDLGCGPGLYTSLLADKGYNVTGIDFNKASIEYAAGKRNDVVYIWGDYIRNYPAGKYDAVTLIYCDLGTHSDGERNCLLQHIYNSLNSGGVFIFDVFTEDIICDKHEENNWEYAPDGGFWNENEYLLLSQTFHFPEANAFAYQYNLVAGSETKRFIVWDRYYSEQEITTLLQEVGFRNITTVRGMLNSNDFTSNSEMFVVAEK